MCPEEMPHWQGLLHSSCGRQEALRKLWWSSKWHFLMGYGDRRVSLVYAHNFWQPIRCEGTQCWRSSHGRWNHRNRKWKGGAGTMPFLTFVSPISSFFILVISWRCPHSLLRLHSRIIIAPVFSMWVCYACTVYISYRSFIKFSHF